ncbi:two-component sensor histidine kinase [Roseomonas arctica]|uniref:histidine kinase n=2 Tax=Plastoroseomonas arctica TaxID=1509237 RepID=A0AAF1K1J5_9PROT|nr:two-component sensor histidine kinase [Plastoroseomonas arctica]
MVGGLPVAAVAALVASGQANPVPGIYAMVVIAVSAMAVSRIWLGNLLRLGERLRGASNDTAQPLVLDDTPLLPAVREVADGVTRLTRSLAERGALVERLRRSDATIIEALPDPLLVLAENRTLLRANGAARALLGLSGAPRGGDAAALLRHPVLADAVDQALRDGAPHAADIMLPVPIPRDIAAQVIPMNPPLADGGRLMLVLADRTRERAVERMRADFVANASHELRTPLASLIGFIETLRGPAEDDAVARTRFLGIMAEQAERMRNLIDDLLGLSRIELTEHQAPTGSADIAAIARAEADAMAPILAGRRASLRVEAPEAALARPADAEQIAQIIRNLLENAIRHGREGGEVALTITHGPRKGVTLTVQDDGIGIAKEHIPRLTERFYRVDKGRSRNAGGTGLGLAIVKHIVIRHRGQLNIESQEGVGSRFSVWLPAD